MGKQSDDGVFSGGVLAGFVSPGSRILASSRARAHASHCLALTATERNHGRPRHSAKRNAMILGAWLAAVRPCRTSATPCSRRLRSRPRARSRPSLGRWRRRASAPAGETSAAPFPRRHHAVELELNACGVECCPTMRTRGSRVASYLHQPGTSERRSRASPSATCTICDRAARAANDDADAVTDARTGWSFARVAPPLETRAIFELAWRAASWLAAAGRRWRRRTPAGACALPRPRSELARLPTEARRVRPREGARLRSVRRRGARHGDVRGVGERLLDARGFAARSRWSARTGACASRAWRRLAT